MSAKDTQLYRMLRKKHAAELAEKEDKDKKDKDTAKDLYSMLFGDKIVVRGKTYEYVDP